MSEHLQFIVNLLVYFAITPLSLYSLNMRQKYVFCLFVS